MSALLSVHNDIYSAFGYDPQTNKSAEPRNVVGAESPVSISVASYTYTDSNSIFLNSSTGLDSNDGTAAAPKKTRLAAMNACTYAKQYIITTNSACYVEDVSSCTNQYYAGIFAATGQTPTYCLRVQSYTDTDVNTVYISKAGNDSNDGSFASKKLTIDGAKAATGASKQHMMICDSGEYTLDGFTFESNAKYLHALKGYKPTLKFTMPSLDDNYLDWTKHAQRLAPITVNTASYSSGIHAVRSLSDNKILLAYMDRSDASTYAQKLILLYEDQTTYKAAVTVCAYNTVLYPVVRTDDSIVVFWADTSDVVHYAIYDEDLTVVTADTTTNITVATSTPLYIGLLTATNEIALTYRTALACYLRVFDYNLSQSWEQTIKSGTTTNHAIGIMSDDSIVTLYRVQSGNNFYVYFKIYDCDGNITKAETLIETVNLYGPDYHRVTILRDDAFAISYKSLANSAVYYTVYDSTGTQTVAPKSIQSVANTHPVSMETLASDYAVVATYSTDGGVYVGKFIVVDSAGNVKKTSTIASSDIGTLQVHVDSVYNLVVGYSLNTPKTLKTSTWYPYSWKAIVGSVPFAIEGIEIDAEDAPCLDWVVSTDQAHTISNCTFEQCYNPTSTSHVCYCDYHTGGGAVTFTNNKLIDHAYAYFVTDSITFSDNKAYDNSLDYVAHITGSSTGIVIEHNKLYTNYGGIKLTSNNGNEVVKNNILYNHLYQGFYASTDVNITYSVTPDDLHNGTLSTMSVAGNPLFINDGFYNIADRNDQIKVKDLGYNVNSPAYNLADDSRDAGCDWVAYIGGAESWTLFQIEKPGKGFKRSIKFVGNVVTQKRDGSIRSKYEGTSEVWEITWTGLKLADWNNILSMLTCGNDQIRFYPDYITYPERYNLYNLVYDDLNLSAAHYRLTRTGYTDITVRFARKYE